MTGPGNEVGEGDVVMLRDVVVRWVVVNPVKAAMVRNGGPGGANIALQGEGGDALGGVHVLTDTELGGHVDAASVKHGLKGRQVGLGDGKSDRVGLSLGKAAARAHTTEVVELTTGIKGSLARPELPELERLGVHHGIPGPAELRER